MSFAAPTGIEQWMHFLSQIRSTIAPDEQIPEPLRRNIGHRLQSLEFETALLLHFLETRVAGGWTLHQTVLRMKIHQCCVTAHTVLEGIGAHFVRVEHKARTGNEIDAEKKIGAPRWKKALSEQTTSEAQQHNLSKTEIRNSIDEITNWRDKIHFDRFVLDDELQFNQFDFRGCYIPTYRTFRIVLTALNQNWPNDCCLNEDIPDAPSS